LAPIAKALQNPSDERRATSDERFTGLVILILIDIATITAKNPMTDIEGLQWSIK